MIVCLYNWSMLLLRTIAILFAVVLVSRGASCAELVMVEQQGCEWCEVWNRDIGPGYHQTSEGKIAPLRRVDIHDELPDDLAFIRGLVYTPTFVLVHDGREVGRILGYPGEDFFWGLLEQLVAKLPRRSMTKERAGSLRPHHMRDKNLAAIEG